MIKVYSTVTVVLLCAIALAVLATLFWPRAIDEPERDLSTLPEHWEEYEDQEHDLTFGHPPQAEITEEAGKTKITYVGPDSHMSEITDGFTFFIHTEELEGMSLEEKAWREFDKETELLESIEEPEPYEYRGYDGYRFLIEGGLGNEITYVVLEKDNRAIIMSHFIADPHERDYHEMVTNIRDSIVR